MFTAEMVRERLKGKEGCAGIDEWIEDYLIDKISSKGNAVISDIRIGYGGMGWSRANFTSEMIKRGFAVEFWCEDRPCGSCYFSISLPEMEKQEK